MSESPRRSAEELRRAFDARFAAPRAERPPDGDRYLGIQLAGDAYAIHLAQVGTVLRCPPITRVPTRRSAILGVATIRGSLVAMYDLASLLAEQRSPRGSGGWAVVCAADRTLALVVDGIEGSWTVAQGERAPLGERSTGVIREVIASDGRGVIDVDAVLEHARGNEASSGETSS